MWLRTENEIVYDVSKDRKHCEKIICGNNAILIPNIHSMFHRYLSLYFRDMASDRKNILFFVSNGNNSRVLQDMHWNSVPLITHINNKFL